MEILFDMSRTGENELSEQRTWWTTDTGDNRTEGQQDNGQIYFRGCKYEACLQLGNQLRRGQTGPFCVYSYTYFYSYKGADFDIKEQFL